MGATSEPDISILVISWNTRSLTEACLDSIPASVGESTTYEVVVADNGSADGSLEMLRGRLDVELIENGRNLGYAAAVNQTFERSTGRLVLLLNSDIDFQPRSLQTLVDFLDE